MEPLKEQVLIWTQQYGYHAVVPSLLLDPAGVPWAWIFLMLLAEEAGRNVLLMLGYGCAVLMLVDHALYWVGRLGGRPLVHRLGKRWPKIEKTLGDAERVVEGRGVWAVAIGRFLPLVGRWVGLAAGLANIPYRFFVLYDALGVAITVIGFGMVAHFVGRKTIDHPLFVPLLTIAFISGMIITLGGCGWQWWCARRRTTHGLL